MVLLQDHAVLEWRARRPCCVCVVWCRSEPEGFCSSKRVVALGGTRASGAAESSCSSPAGRQACIDISTCVVGGDVPGKPGLCGWSRMSMPRLGKC